MNMKEIQDIARRVGVKPRGKAKAVLIKEIQTAEGNFDCFGSAAGYCDQLACAFYDDCLNENAARSEKTRKIPKPQSRTQ